jgi:hypothetical protein
VLQEAGVDKGPHTMGFLQDVCKAVGQETFEATMADLEVRGAFGEWTAGVYTVGVTWIDGNADA